MTKDPQWLMQRFAGLMLALPAAHAQPVQQAAHPRFTEE